MEVKGLYRNTVLAKLLKECLSSVAGICEVKANPLTGRILVLYEAAVIDLPGIRGKVDKVVSTYHTLEQLRLEAMASRQIAAAAVYESEPGGTSRAGLYALTTGGVLAAIFAKRLVAGRSSLASSPQVFNLVALTTIISGYPLFRSGVKSLIRHKRVNHDMVIFIASLLMLAMRESITGLSILWIVHLANFFQFVVQARSRTHIENMIQQKQQQLLSLEAERRQRIQEHDIRIGDVLALHSGEMIPVDGKIIAGQAELNRAAVSGDCMPYFASQGDVVRAGSLIEAGSIQIQVHNIDNTPYIPLAYDVAKYEGLWHISDRYVDKVMWWSLTIAGLIFLFTRDIPRSIAVLLAGSPAAISLARNSAVGAAIAQATGDNIYVKEPRALEAAGEADAVVFDKTGTLTEAVPHISEVVALGGMSEDEVIRLAAAAGQRECHPYNRVLQVEAAKRGLQLPSAGSRFVLGRGVCADIAGKRVAVGNQALMQQEKVLTGGAKDKITRMELNGKTVVYVAVNRELCGLIAVWDKIRAASFESVAALRCLGIENMALLTGDAAPAAEAVAATLAIPCTYGGVLPDEKAKIIRNVKRHDYKVIMVGDGMNDAHALQASDVGIVMGKIGAESSINKADIVIGDDDPVKIAKTVVLGKRLNEVVKQNIALAAGLNIIGIALAAVRLISPLTAGLLANISTLGVVINSGRLLTSGRNVSTAQPLNLQRFTVNESSLRSMTAGDEKSSLPLEPKKWYGMSPEETCEELGTSNKWGLSEQDAALRGLHYGYNRLAARPKPSFWRQLLDQFKDFMVQVLIGAAGLSFLLGKRKDAMLTVGIVTANAFLGVAQERKAGQSLDALQELTAPQARVIRAGRQVKVNASAVVPGDMIVLEAGDRVPADARLLRGVHFEVEEASLTGETVPVKKQYDKIEKDQVALGDRRNMVFMGTTVTRGRATAVVVATGMQTEMGKIASLIGEQKEEPTPLQRRLEELGKYLVYGCLAVSGLVFLAGTLRGEPMINMLQTGASLAVAAIPEGLSAIVLIALAMGVQRMSKRNIIVRRLSSIENLGSATVICSDKTGTLTQNQMTVREVYSPAGYWSVSGEGYDPAGKFMDKTQSVKPNGLLKKIATIAVLCNNAKLMKPEAANRKVIPLRTCTTPSWTIDGDPTEGALLTLAAKAGINIDQFSETHCRVVEYPFESERCMMSVLCSDDSKQLSLYSKGAPDKILSLCTHYTDGEHTYPLDEATRQDIEQANNTMAAKALRVLACAYRTMEKETDGQDQVTEDKLIFGGLVGMIDPPRAEVPEAIAKCHRAGVKVVMITGDHPNTARAIGQELGLLKDNGRIITGLEIDNMTDEELAEAAQIACIFARTTPQHKMRIVKAFQSRGEVVAMTGDGVNDAPAVKAADIGIAMGITGTDVTKEAACMTLADDNFATIVKAMEEGRSIYNNIRKAIRYLVATNIGEVVLMFLAVVLGMPLPLIPIQLLWINLVGDGLPAVALVNDPPPDNIMEQAPQSSSESVFAQGLGRKIMSRGLIIGISSLLLYGWKLRQSGNVLLARSFVLAQLAISQFIHIFDCRIEQGMRESEFLNNTWLFAAIALSVFMIIGSIHLPLLQPIFGTVPLTVWEWSLALIVSIVTAAFDFWLWRNPDREIRPLPQLRLLQEE